MRQLSIPFIMFFMFFLGQELSAQDELNAEKLKGNAELREEVFTAILEDESLIDSFLDHAVEDTMAMHQIMMNEEFMNRMMSMRHMQMMENRNPEMMKMMMEHMAEMAQHDTTMQNMMMNNEKMQQMMQKMQQKEKDSIQDHQRHHMND
ncbi:MAG: hypothetical protein ACNS62_17370 [Candidatus Cyclobacteriaceae bacterium M3_2C_046]